MTQIDISIVVAIYNEEKVLPELYNRLIPVLTSISENYEVILVDDGSKDRSWEVIESLSKKNEKIKGIKFTKNFGQHVAITAGLDNSNGDYIVLMDADLQDQPEEIPKMLKKCKEGFEIVYAVRKTRAESFLKRMSGKSFYFVFNKLSSFELRPDIGIFRVMTRLVRDNIVQMREQTRIITGLIDWLGFPSAHVEIDRPERFSGETKYGIRRLLRLAMQGIMSFSNLPLRFATYMGLTVSVASMLLGFYFIIKKIFYDIELIGWPSLITAVLFLGGVQMMVIGILGEYIGRIFIDIKQRPLYVISKRV